MQEFDYLIVGGGLAAASAVDGIRELDDEGSIGVFTEEPDPPYHRPPLSKEFLQAPKASRELLQVKPSKWFEEQSGITLCTSVRIDRLDPHKRTVQTGDGNEIRGNRILIATGGKPRTLMVPGAELHGVATLRTAADSEWLRVAAAKANHVVLVGAGFIGMELASSLNKLKVETTVIDVETEVWANVFPSEISAFLQSYFEKRGVHFLLGAQVTAFDGVGALSRVIVETDDEIAADLAVVGIGIKPTEELAAQAGLVVQNGIVVDVYGETTADYVYAAGDVARFPDPIWGDLVRTEHWDHAKAHGKIVGRNMTGAREPYEYLSYFFTHVFDLSINVFGRTGNPDRVIVSGKLSSGRSVIYCARNGLLMGTILINAHDAMDECRKRVQAELSVEDLLKTMGNPDMDWT
jgi:3-phenylpropionate/trans-cinnamate dioxygenase ferredoxin reductase subunit